MANIKSAKKRSKTNEIRRQNNVARRSDIKTSIKRYLASLQEDDVQTATNLFKATESKISRSVGKGLMKKNTASRKISRLAKKLAQFKQKSA
ncbi:30S ribosomal protein S20 [Candidatus Dependentiae bacterium]|nr:30S ribosomal protein S20 [Candidatus Dependentiae bacterium]